VNYTRCGVGFDCPAGTGRTSGEMAGRQGFQWANTTRRPRRSRFFALAIVAPNKLLLPTRYRARATALGAIGDSPS